MIRGLNDSMHMKTIMTPTVTPLPAPHPRLAIPSRPRSGQNSRRRAWIARVVWAALLTQAAADAQNYSVDWFKIAGGGGTSTGGVFTLSGTIGQPDAGAMTNGSFALVGGFWSYVAAVQTEGAPILRVARTETNSVKVSWARPADGWSLTWTNALAGGTNAWPAISPALYQTNATEIFYVEPAPVMGSRFYRLRKP
jgi:hypothetical protein